MGNSDTLWESAPDSSVGRIAWGLALQGYFAEMFGGARDGTPSLGDPDEGGRVPHKINFGLLIVVCTKTQKV